LAFLHAVAGLLRKNDAARDQAGDLSKPHVDAFAVDRHGVALIFAACNLAARHDEGSLRILDLFDSARNGRAIDVHVEDVEENAEARQAAIRNDPDHFTVCRRDGHWTVRYRPLGVAEEVETKKTDEEKRDRKKWIGEVPNHRAACEQRKRVID